MKVTVLLPVYNGKKYLKNAIESILFQEFGDFEFLIIDDASSDGSSDIIRGYAKKDRRIHAVFHTSNVGLANTLNEGLNLSKGTYIARMDQDDESLPQRLKTQYMFMETRPEIALSGSYVYHIAKTNQRLRLIKVPIDPSEIQIKLESENCFYHPSVIFRRQEINSLGGYQSKYKNTEDYDLWLRASKKYKMANIPIPLLRYRININGMTVDRRWEQLFYFFLAQAENAEEQDRQSPEQVAENKIKGIDRNDFFVDVTQKTAEDLLRAGFLNDTFRLLWNTSHEIGLKCLFKVVRNILQTKAIYKSFIGDDTVF